MKFCPRDGMTLVLDNESSHGGYRFRCAVCPYVKKLQPNELLSLKTKYETKKVGDVLGGEEAWKNVPETDAFCRACQHTRAYYMQLQTRSADEPMTIFYKCVKCKKQWKE